MNFQEAASYLFSLGNEVETMKLGLDNIRKLLAALGDPQKNYLKVQVAGTNGKGSVCAFLDSICGEAAINRGVFTSPHLVSVTERVRINGSDISEDDFARYATTVRETAEQMVAKGELEYTPTFFEQVTAIALLAFADAKVDLAILETGLGGRLDATTAADAEIAAITRIDLDHQEYLGETIADIAAEKAAIIQDGSKVVVGEQTPEALAVILDVCSAHSIEAVRTNNISTTIPADLGLRGGHQIENAKTAAALAEVLRGRFGITDAHIDAGLERASHPGRLEFDGRVLFDGAHNIGGAIALRQFLDESVDQPITLIFGAMKGKNLEAFADLIFPKANWVILTRVESPRSMTPIEITSAVGHTPNLEIAPNVEEALIKAGAVAGDSGVILVTGSLYLIGEVKKLLRAQI